MPDKALKNSLAELVYAVLHVGTDKNIKRKNLIF